MHVSRQACSSCAPAVLPGQSMALHIVGWGLVTLQNLIRLWMRDRTVSVDELLASDPAEECKSALNAYSRMRISGSWVMNPSGRRVVANCHLEMG